ncbi:MAG: hypothetical protein ABIO04_11375 [Ferruginibacter sp.]
MKHKLIFTLSTLISLLFIYAIPAKVFDKIAFYSSISSEVLEVIDAQLELVKAASFPEKQAFEGALLMKKAGVIKGTAKEKLNLFKSGRVKLEAAISKSNDNVEYRFLRLIIQEHAPKILKYRNEIETDSQLVRTNFKNLPEILQKFVVDYSKNSKALKIAG